MGRTLDDVIAALPDERRQRVEARFQELKEEVEGLGELRRVAGKAQAEIAAALNVKQPSVSKIEKQADMYLSTLRSYVEAIGGQLDLVVRLPSRPPLRIDRLSDVLPSNGGRPRARADAPKRIRSKKAQAG
jgi:regulator of protease activity HflC (stomatin/prohibitin superfamily)